MDRRICLDSDILIALLKGDKTAKKILESVDAELYTTSVNVFEIWFGRTKEEIIAELFGSLRLLAFGEGSARLAADMLRTLKERGTMVDFRDAFIAAMCIRHNAELLTGNKRHFERLNEFGLTLVNHS
jgi:predicted nucleic acid-binding protein